ncbi:TIGR03618 family F420-dependent PPOX class oxidoreductase [Umezawaea sp. Da 62-37]|uniref:TIGR03618 family F420-dependent PPOX class oxidoreductase n=1 Tax=Umezawaea sp. Da 62-37 TaxID=3075927 RepID=UPI0028F6F71C|nr:TIGR03618 family F420-dependent PPOX class oxidoreductase [Umezawaea sp. Da 62-37]WNV88976.1 TIGR03618 family F420-dependent PPOX class oxidoreductase [Umezawaea sp. Da 62-37]
MDEKVETLLRAPNFAHIATVRRDGSASATPVWVDLEDDLVLVNGMAGRVWPRNLARDPRITVSVSALANPYECATLRGHALAPTTEDADAHFDRIFEKYRNRTMPPSDDDPQEHDRLLFRVVVESTHYQWQPPPGATAEYDAFLAQIMNPTAR